MSNVELLKQVDDSLKDKLKEAKAKKNMEDLMGLIALVANELKESNEQIKQAIASIKIDVDAPPITIQHPPITVPEIKLPELPAFPPFPEIKVPEASVKVEIPDLEENTALLKKIADELKKPHEVEVNLVIT